MSSVAAEPARPNCARLDLSHRTCRNSESTRLVTPCPSAPHLDRRHGAPALGGDRTNQSQPPLMGPAVQRGSAGLDPYILKRSSADAGGTRFSQHENTLEGSVWSGPNVQSIRDRGLHW